MKMSTRKRHGEGTLVIPFFARITRIDFFQYNVLIVGNVVYNMERVLMYASYFPFLHSFKFKSTTMLY